MAIVMNLSMWLTGINTVLVLALIYVYITNLKKIKSIFTLGLLIFAILFLIQNVVSFYYFITMMPYYVPEVETHVFMFTAVQTIAFSVLNWITWR